MADELKAPIVVDLEKSAMQQLYEAVSQSNWIPPEYMMNDWIGDCAHFLRTGEGTHIEPEAADRGPVSAPPICSACGLPHRPDFACAAIQSLRSEQEGGQ